MSIFALGGAALVITHQPAWIWALFAGAAVATVAVSVRQHLTD